MLQSQSRKHSLPVRHILALTEQSLLLSLIFFGGEGWNTIHLFIIHICHIAEYITIDSSADIM